MLAWTYVDEHQRAVEELQGVMEGVVPERLATAVAAAEELTARYNALRRRKEDKVGGLLT